MLESRQNSPAEIPAIVYSGRGSRSENLKFPGFISSRYNLLKSVVPADGKSTLTESDPKTFPGDQFQSKSKHCSGAIRFRRLRGGDLGTRTCLVIYPDFRFGRKSRGPTEGMQTVLAPILPDASHTNKFEF